MMTKKLKSNSSQRAVEIPQDLWTEIIARVPIDLVGKFRRLSKFHRDLISSSSFKKTQSDLSQKIPPSCRYVILPDYVVMKTSDLANSATKQYQKFIPPFRMIDYHCEGCCKGILLMCSRHTEANFMLWNPFTGVTTKSVYCTIPSNLILGYDAETDDFKILKIVVNFSRPEMYSLKSGSWRKKTINPPVHMLLHARPVFVEGTSLAHMIGVESDTYKRVIITFDFKTEEFNRTDLPRDLQIAGVSLWSCKGHLYSYAVSKGKFQMWEMKDYGVINSIWGDVLSFDYDTDTSLASDLRPVAFVNDERQILILSPNWLHLYDLNEKTLKNQVSLQEHKYLKFRRWCLIYTPSLAKLFNAEEEDNKKIMYPLPPYG